MTKVTFGPETVGKIYTDWIVSEYQRRDGDCLWDYLQEFGAWLRPQGGTLRRDNYRYYIDFHDLDRASASFFMLKYL